MDESKYQNKFEIVPISTLKEYEYNSRTHSEEQVEQLKRSIKEFGFTNPVLVDEDDILIAGHGRVAAARELNMQEVPAIRILGISEQQKKALRIADNQLALNAGWDEEMLSKELAAIQADGFDLDLLGFSTDELERLLDSTGGFGDEEENAEPGGGAEREIAYKEQYGVIVMCKDEEDQERIYNRLSSEGYECKVVAT